jgi:hypothetical protein
MRALLIAGSLALLAGNSPAHAVCDPPRCFDVVVPLPRRDLVRDLRGAALFVATGDGTMGGPAGDIANPGAYIIEQVVLQMNLSFMRALDTAGVPYRKDFYPGGYHGWPYWQRELHWALPEMMAVIGSVK